MFSIFLVLLFQFISFLADQLVRILNVVPVGSKKDFEPSAACWQASFHAYWCFQFLLHLRLPSERVSKHEYVDLSQLFQEEVENSCLRILEDDTQCFTEHVFG